MIFRAVFGSKHGRCKQFPGIGVMIDTVVYRTSIFAAALWRIGIPVLGRFLLHLSVLGGSSLVLNLDARSAGEPISLSWNDNSNNETGFRIERSTDNIAFVEIAVVGENVTRYTDFGPFDARQIYAYRVRAYNEFGNSGYTNTRTTYYDPPPVFFFGELGSDGGSFAMMCRADGSAVLVGKIESGTSGTLVQEFQVSHEGVFEFNVLGLGTFMGQIIDGQIIGSIETSSQGTGGLSIANSDIALTGSAAKPDGSTAGVAGLYDTGHDPLSESRLIILAGPDGNGFALSSLGSELSGGFLDLSAESPATTSLEDGTRVSVGFADIEGVVSGTVMRDGETFNFVGQDEESRKKSVFLNVSMRSPIGGGATIIAGFVVAGVGEKRLLIRGIGPALGNLGVQNPVLDPRLELFRLGEPEPIGENDDWGAGDVSSITEYSASVGAFQLDSEGKDAALVVNASAGLYWLHMKNKSSRPGTGLVEIYDLDAESSSNSLVNLSLRGEVMGSSDPIIAGFVVSGESPKGVMVRAMGRELRELGVTETLEDPVLTLYGSGGLGGLVADNSDWEEDSNLLNELANEVGAFTFQRGSRSAAKAMWLRTGLYTAVVSGRSSESGEVLVELYAIP